eukprot:TRINITY_DN14658_c0_g1_i1.p1 TRINITY_DN14658_c0_g1~~TRINITY_DN14658_c0_g1_i1.p1  ORF type:complete len:401 (-),score=102.33 TRINITY_DN14658_c0_g1_i1:31-1233(-)
MTMMMRQIGLLFVIVAVIVVGFVSFGRITSTDSVFPQQNDQLAAALSALANKEKEIDRLMTESQQIKSLSERLIDNKELLESERRRKDELVLELQSLKDEVRKLVADFRDLMREASSLINQKNEHPTNNEEVGSEEEEEELVTKQPIIKTTAKLHDQATCFKHKLFILSKQRSGTHFLKSLLDQHPVSFSNNELFRTPRIMNSYFNKTWHEQNKNFTVQQTKEYIQRLMGRRYNSFVLQGNHRELYPQVVPVVKEMDYYAIHLYRRNVLKMLISQAVDELSNQAVCVPGHECAGKSTVIKLDTNKLLSSIKTWISQQEHNREALRKYKMHWMEVNYDELTRNHTIACDVLAFMGCECFPFAEEAVTTQINTRKNEDVVENYDEVVKTLTGTKYEYLLHID